MNNCEYLGLFGYKREVLKQIAENEDFLRFSNVRRHTVANLNEEEIMSLYEMIRPEILVFILTDPTLEGVNGTSLKKWFHILGKLYEQYTNNRIKYYGTQFL